MKTLQAKTGSPRCSAPADTHRRVSILLKIVRQSLLLTGVTVVLLTATAGIVVRSLLQQRALRELSVTVAAREDHLEEIFRADRERVALLARREEVVRAANDGLSQGVLQSLYDQFKAEGIPLRGMGLFAASGDRLWSAGDAPATVSVRPETTFLAIFGQGRVWKAYDVAAPVQSPEGELIDMIVVRYDTQPLAEAVFASRTGSATEQMLVGWREGEDLYVLQSSLRAVSAGSYTEALAMQLPLALAVSGIEGAGRWRGDAEQDILTAYHYLPSVGWGIAVDMQTEEGLSGVRNLTAALIALGGLLLQFAGLLGYFLSRHLTRPLLHLADKMTVLRPGKWEFRRSVHTGDEVETLDAVAADLTHRLQGAYEHLEELVAERTVALKEQFALDRAILENIEYGVIAIDPRGNITDANPAALTLLGWPRTDVLGKPGTDILMLRKHRRGDFTPDTHPIARCLKTRTVFRSTPTMFLSIMRRDASLLPVNLLVTPLLEGKKLLGAIVVFQDTTEERQIEYMKSEFISLASHQLRTPISSLRWYSELLLGDRTAKLTTAQRDYVREIETAGRRMANLLDALLRVARLEGEGIAAKKQRIDLAMAVRQIAEELNTTSKEADIACDIHVPKKSVFVATDVVLLRIVLQNVFSNAVKYSHQGGQVVISMEEKKHAVDILVKDKGLGIPKDEQDRIFQKFFRAKNVRTKDTDGSGLGLYISKKIMDNLSGKISFESVEGKGTTVTITLPRS